MASIKNIVTFIHLIFFFYNLSVVRFVCLNNFPTY